MNDGNGILLLLTEYLKKARKGSMPLFAGVFLLSFVLAPREALPNTSSESTDKKHQIEKLEEDLSQQKEQYQKFGEKERTLLEKLTDLEKSIAEKRGNINELHEKLVKAKKNLKEREASLKKQENSMRNVEDRLGRRLDAFYRYAKRGYVRTLATSTGLDELRRRITYLRAIMGEDYRLLKDMIGLQKECRRQINLAKDEMTEVDRLEAEDARQLASLKQDLDKRVILLMQIHREKEFYETAVKELQSAAQGLKDTLDSLQKTQEGKKDGQAELPTDFERSRGKLPLPLKGRIVKESGYGGGGQNGGKGIFIEGAAGAEVKAVFPGRVDFSGRIRGYGEMVIINHGSRYFTISARLAKRSRVEGEMVNAGDAVGLLGSSDGVNKPRLYFEIRKGESLLDPVKWLKVH
jgi:septal ring factor EnvC (AmiA/AmiB activator)